VVGRTFAIGDILGDLAALPRLYPGVPAVGFRAGHRARHGGAVGLPASQTP
jgi:hypothetical protein